MTTNALIEMFFNLKKYIHYGKVDDNYEIATCMNVNSVCLDFGSSVGHLSIPFSLWEKISSIAHRYFPILQKLEMFVRGADIFTNIKR